MPTNSHKLDSVDCRRGPRFGQMRLECLSARLPLGLVGMWLVACGGAVQSGDRAPANPPPGSPSGREEPDEARPNPDAAPAVVPSSDVVEVEGAVVPLAPEAPDSPMLNRVVGLGLDGPATEAQVDTALDVASAEQRAAVARIVLLLSDCPRSASCTGAGHPPCG